MGRTDEQRPLPARPASTDNFVSEHEVVRMLSSLNSDKIRAENEVMRLKKQIELLSRSAGSPKSTLSAGNSMDQLREGSGEWDWGMEKSISGTVRGSTRSIERADLSSIHSAGDASGMENVTPELENFMRLRSFILHMQGGASLLLWREDGLQLCWFWLDEECSTLYWDLDEGEGSRADEPAGIGGILPLERIDDIVPLGAGPDQLSDSPTDSSFSLVVGDERLDIVAPTSFDFQVWYFGLAFATRMRLNAVKEGEGEEDHDASRGEWAGSAADKQNEVSESEDGDSLVGRRREPNVVGSADDAFDDAFVAGEGDSDVGDAAIAHRMEEQRHMIQHLQKENSALRELRRSKDEAISRLLRDVKAAEEARGEAEAKTPATSQESDRHWHHREIYTVRGRNSKLLEMIQVKDACIQELWAMLRLSLDHQD